MQDSQSKMQRRAFLRLSAVGAGAGKSAGESPGSTRAAAAFTLRYELRGATLLISLEDVREGAGWELIEVAMPSLASVREGEAGAWLAHGEDGGSLVRLREAKA